MLSVSESLQLKHLQFCQHYMFATVKIKKFAILILTIILTTVTIQTLLML